MTAPARRRFYGEGLPGIDVDTLHGRLIVVEGADGSGRSTQIALLKDWLELEGHATVDVGLSRSALAAAELQRAKRGNILGRTTLSLFYATDFADQIENRIMPALKAGFVVLADRYIFTLMARDIVRGADRTWVESLYGIAPVPDAVFYLKVGAPLLIERRFKMYRKLDYWESGMDIGLSRDMFDSFMKYQKLIQAEFRRMADQYEFVTINGNRSEKAVASDLQAQVRALIGD